MNVYFVQKSMSEHINIRFYQHSRTQNRVNRNNKKCIHMICYYIRMHPKKIAWARYEGEKKK